MTDAQFYNCFCFRVLEFNKYHMTDHTKTAGSPKHYLGCLLEGSGKLCVRDQTIPLSVGQVFYIPKGQKYQSHWYPSESGSVKFYSYGFELVPETQSKLYPMQPVTLSPEAQVLFQKLTASTQINCLSIGLLYSLWGIISQTMQEAPETSRNVIIKKALEYMHAQETYSVPDIAEYCGISSSGLYALFRQQLQKTPVEVKHEILIARATELLVTTDLTVEEISNRLAFSSPSYFRKVFKTQTRKHPLEYRKYKLDGSL